jgi:hypothetical protein
MSRMKLKHRFIILIWLIFLGACLPQAKFLAPDYARPGRVAILPTINQTTDVSGGIVIRNLLYEELEDEETFALLHPLQIDSLLNLEGITDGGQLSSMADSTLQRILVADGLLYITLLECEFSSIGISSTRIVRVNFKLYTADHNLLWEDEREVDKGKSVVETVIGMLVDPETTVEESVEDFGEQMGEKAMKMWLTEHELKDEMLEIIHNSIDTLP